MTEGTNPPAKILKKMNLNLIPVFVEVYTQNSVTLAAARMETSPSSISQSLNRLREYFGDALFVRDGLQLKPTPTAIKIYNSIQDDYSNLIQHINIAIK